MAGRRGRRRVEENIMEKGKVTQEHHMRGERQTGRRTGLVEKGTGMESGEKVLKGSQQS